VEVRGVAAALAGSYVLTAVTHTCDARKGFVSQIDTTPPPSRARATGAAASLGVVTQLDDPERLGRVRVSLPAYGDLETDWLGVLAAGAGAGKGLVALPDVGDQVLVLFAHEDTAQGVVLGGLYGVAGPPDAGLEDGAVRRYTLLTPGGQRLRLDDDRQLVRIENSDGSYLELAPDRVRLHARRDLEIEAPGRAVVIRGQSIDFERS
jgi:phage baseplate assembly protein gpV